MTDNRYIIIGRSNCPFCTAAVDYCTGAGMQHVFLDYVNAQEVLQDYKDFHNHPTVPIILENNLETGRVTKVGGYQDFIKLLLME